MPNVSSGQHRDISGLTKWVVGLLYAQILISCISIISGGMEYSLLSDFASGVYTDEAKAIAAGEASDNRQLVVAYWFMAIYMVSAVLILRWFYLSKANAIAAGAADTEFTPGWTIGWYFVPFANLWKPYQAMKELWKTSHAPDGWKEQGVSSLIGWWWFIFLASGAISNAAFRATLRAEELNELMLSNVLTQISDMSGIPLAIVTLLIVKRIYAAQSKPASPIGY